MSVFISLKYDHYLHLYNYASSKLTTFIMLQLTSLSYFHHEQHEINYSQQINTQMNAKQIYATIRKMILRIRFRLHL